MNPQATPAASHDHWYQQPVLWLAAALLLAIIAGCISMIVLGVRHADEAVPVRGETMFKVPTAQPAAPPARDDAQ